MTAAVPVLFLVLCRLPTWNKSQIGFVHEPGGIQRLARLLIRQLLRRESTKFLIHQR